jgi:RNA polymerase sigma factor (TIGR02999 family)
MDDDGKIELTALISRLAQDEPGVSPEALLPVVYRELRRLAQAYLGGERADHSLQATELVHEAYLRLVDQANVDWQGRTHFFAAGARAMRQLLVDHARHRGRQKRGGDWQRVTLDKAIEPLRRGDLTLEDVLSIDAAIEELTTHSARQARIVELRFFAGLSVAEVASLLKVSKRTVEGDWAHARAWLKRRLAHR